MALYDLPFEQLETYRPEVAEPEDFDAFWAETLEQTRRHPLDPSASDVRTGLRLIRTQDVAFSGYGGDRVQAWLHSPGEDPLGCVVELIGYGGGRGLAHERLTWAAAGWAHLIVDTRGQGSSWSVGVTPDVERDGGNPQHPGFMTRGVRDPRTYYYRRLIADAVRAVEAARELVRPRRLVLRGSSQGGGVALAAAALAPDVDGLLADVPFLCHIRRGVELTDEDPYAEVARYLRVHRDHTADVFRTLSYVDGVNFAARAAAPALFSVALMDEICPPSTVYAAYNRYAGPKEIAVYEFNGHEGGEAHQLARQLAWVSR